MKVQAKHVKVTQNMHGGNKNYRYVWDVSPPPPVGAPGGLLGAWGHSLAPLWPIFTPLPKTLEDKTIFHELLSVPPPPRFQDWGCHKTLSGHPVGGRIDHRELLQHHDRFPDEP